MVKLASASLAFIGTALVTPYNGFAFAKRFTHFYDSKGKERSPTAREAALMPIMYFLAFAGGIIIMPFLAAYYAWDDNNERAREHLKSVYFPGPEIHQRTNITFWGLSAFMLIGIAVTLIGGFAFGSWELAFSPVTEWYDLENARQFVMAAFVMTVIAGWICALMDYYYNDKYCGVDSLTLDHQVVEEIQHKQAHNNQQNQNNKANPPLPSYLQKQGSSFRGMATSPSDFDKLKTIFDIENDDMHIIMLTFTPSSTPAPENCPYTPVNAQAGYLSKILYKDDSNHIYSHSTDPGDDGYVYIGQATEAANGKLTLTVTKPPKFENK